MKTMVAMSKLLAAVCLALGIPAVILAAEAPAAPPTGFGEVVQVHVVNVEVYATDKDGRRVSGLHKDDFTVFEDGKPVKITNFDAVDRSGSAAPAAAPVPPPSPESVATPPAPSTESGLSLAVLIDNFHLRPGHRSRALEQVRKFLARLAPDDRIMLATYDLTLNVRQGFTADRAAVDAALAATESLPTYGQQQDNDRRTAVEAMYALYDQDPCGYTMVTPIENYASAMRDEAHRTIGAFKVLVSSLAGVPGRKALLLVSDGIAATPGEELFQVFSEVCGANPTSGLPQVLSNDSPLSSRYPVQQALVDAQKYSVAKKLEDLAAHANANRVTIYTLQATGLQGSGATQADLGTHERVLQMPSVQQVLRENDRGSLFAMASDTGGRATFDANDFLPDLSRMQEDFASYYSLGYSPSHAGDGLQHRIEVKVRQPGVHIRYRQSYRDKPDLERVADRTLSALFYGTEDNPLDIAMTLGEPTQDADAKTWEVPVRLKIPLFKVSFVNREGQPFQGKLRLLVVTENGQGGLSPLRQVDVPLTIPRLKVLTALGQSYLYTLTLKLPAGPHRLALAARDELGAKTSYLSLPLTVGPAPAPTGAR